MIRPKGPPPRAPTSLSCNPPANASPPTRPHFADTVAARQGQPGRRRALSRFYAHHFAHSDPADTESIPISRMIGADRIVAEQLSCFTHDREIDWMLPGVAPTAAMGRCRWWRS
ncbi:hypothetical protein [Nocardia farcinica]|uniref:Uncharacterized protein n=1 Tax=Nocardia farcinica (strain IFM 10152) TaxID=247156 RepID=Q5Z0E6_NOCFA|nr:hypothetical protein [Nocardia farcinica]MCZ9328524.1 hypothetical protein [Nocardia farcinica]BAD56095.1 hypothetical protein NFA_12500 [Nocardia farcinica IFM 10152]